MTNIEQVQNTGKIFTTPYVTFVEQGEKDAEIMEKRKSDGREEENSR